MTDYAVQNNGPSGLAWGTTGAIVGAGTGAALAKWAKVGIPTQAYKSWDEAVAAVNKDDKFIKKQIEKGGDNAANWTKLQENAEVLKAAKEDLLKAFPEDLRKHADVDKYLTENTKMFDLITVETKKVLNSIKTGQAIEGLDPNSPTFLDDLKTYVKNLDNIKAQDNVLKDLETKLKGLAGVDDGVLKNFDSQIDNFFIKRAEVASNLGDNILKTLKKPSLKWTALAGAAVAAALALIAKPKNKEV